MSHSDAIGRARRSAKIRKRVAGVAFLVTGALLIWLSLALYNKQFSSVAMVTVYTSSVGNEMHPGNQVMVRGVQVGEVRQVNANGAGARLLLAMDPGELPKLPTNVSAEMLPTTLFGERYVDLVLPSRPAPNTLTAGSVIRQNRSGDALELEQVLNNLLPMLRAVQPDKLSLTLTAIAQGLAGRGTELGQTLVTLNAFLKELNPQLPQFDTDIRRLAGLTKTYNEATPDLLAALNNFSISGQTLASERFNYAALLTNFKTASDDLRAFLNANGPNSVALSNDSIPSLGILARYAPEYPCTLANLADFVPQIDKVLGAGSNEPGLHVRVLIVPSLGAYKAGKDTPVYGDNLGPHCYVVPFKGIHLHDGARHTKAAQP
ncbi:MAG TPA: MCE family protein [Streptosporangiaceae bacterium]